MLPITSKLALVAMLGLTLSACGGAKSSSGPAGPAQLVSASDSSATENDSNSSQTAGQAQAKQPPAPGATTQSLDTPTLVALDDDGERYRDGERRSGSDSDSSSSTALSLDIRRAEYDDQRLEVRGSIASRSRVTLFLFGAGSNTQLASTRSDEDGRWQFRVGDLNGVPCRVRVESGDTAGERDVDGAPANCTSGGQTGGGTDGGTTTPPVAISGSHQLFAFNDLGMHCMDADYTLFSVLPPFNTLHAQILQRGTTGSSRPTILDPSQVEITYKAIADQRGSINTTSTTTSGGAKKTQFWDYANVLYGASPAPDVGLTGTPMPGPTNTPRPFDDFNTGHQWYVAEGIPITPIDDAGNTNNYPLFRIEAMSKADGSLLDTLDVVVPVSTDMNCNTCHLTGQAASVDPAVNWSTNPNLALQTKENILLLHDQREGTTLFADKPVLCAGCHYSPALDLAGAGPNGPQVGKKFLSRAVHGRHGRSLNGGIPDSANPPITPDSGISTCYNCHPGEKTQCFRGAMFTAGIACQDCHGGMLAVGGVYNRTDTNQPRFPWVDLPKCQSCHTGDAVNNQGGIRLHVAYDPNDPSATPRLPSNKRFAEPDTTLFRNSGGHGGLACSACHGSPHAIWPVANGDPTRNDNVAAMQLQGHAGTIIECSTCHESLPLTLGGPHGMHNVGSDAWTDGHERFYESNPTSCRTCHGLNLEGTVLSTAQTTRTHRVEGRTVTITKGTQVSCTLCHSRP